MNGKPHRRAVVIGNYRIIQKIRLVVDVEFLFQPRAGLVLLLGVQFTPIGVLARLKSGLKLRGKGDNGRLRAWNIPF